VATTAVAAAADTTGTINSTPIDGLAVQSIKFAFGTGSPDQDIFIRKILLSGGFFFIMRLPIPHFIPLLFLLISCGQKEKADHIYLNAKIWTGDSLMPSADAIGIKNGTLLFVGKDYPAYQDSHTILTDLQGKMVVPGFIDNHTHFLAGGFQLASVDLRQAGTKETFILTLREFTQRAPDGQWILGGDWDHEAWGGQLPKKEWIDSISSDHPILISRYDGHMALANSMALKLAGIDRKTANPPGGEIVRDRVSGEPTGILRDKAESLVEKVIPLPTEAELDLYLDRAVRFALSYGVTEVQDMGSFGGWQDLATYQRAQARHKLGIRIYSFVPTSTWKKLDSFVKKNGWGDDWLHWGGLKGFVDGSLGSTTAWFYKPYLDAPNSTGLQVTDTHYLKNWILQADSAGLHLTNHAIGDRANDWILEVYAQAISKNGKRDRRFRVEHAQHLTQSAIGRFSELGVIASMQPYHEVDDGKWAAKRLDSDRLSRTYAFRSLLDKHAILTFGTDWTVAPINPLLGIYAAVTRRTGDGKNPGGWFPEQKISVDEALKCYTSQSAFSAFQENQLGTLKPGYQADFVVLSEDLFHIPPENIKDVKVLITVLGGKEVYRRKDQ
jgi:predicted amidohydrolase YtcJ